MTVMPSSLRRPALAAVQALVLVSTSGALGALLTAGPARAQPAAASAPAAAASGPTVRAEYAKPLQAAQAAIAAKNYAEALARVIEAEALPAPTPYETYIIRRIKAPALFGTGDVAKSLDAFESVLPMPELPASERLPIIETSAKLALQLKDYPRALGHVKAFFAGGGSSAEFKRLQPQLMAITGDHAGAAREFEAYIAAEQAAGRAPSETTLRQLAASQDAAGDAAGYQKSVERLAVATGKADYWQMLVAKLVRQNGFADERLRLDVYRFRRAAGLELQGGEIADMAYRALQAGLPAEAKALLDEGFEKKLLGVGADAASDQKLREQANKSAAQDQAGWADGETAARNAKEGNAAVNLGFALSGAGQHERGLALMTAGVAKGGLRRPDEAQLHLGVAQWRAGQAEASAKSMAGVNGADGIAGIARLWTLLAQRAAQPK